MQPARVERELERVTDARGIVRFERRDDADDVFVRCEEILAVGQGLEHLAGRDRSAGELDVAEKRRAERLGEDDARTNPQSGPVGGAANVIRPNAQRDGAAGIRAESVVAGWNAQQRLTHAADELCAVAAYIGLDEVHRGAADEAGNE